MGRAKKEKTPEEISLPHRYGLAMAPSVVSALSAIVCVVFTIRANAIATEARELAQSTAKVVYAQTQADSDFGVGAGPPEVDASVVREFAKCLGACAAAHEKWNGCKERCLQDAGTR